MDTLSRCLYWQCLWHVYYSMSAPRWNNQHSTPLFGVVLLLKSLWSGAIFCTIWRPTFWKKLTKGFPAWVFVMFIFDYVDSLCMCSYCQFFGLVYYSIFRRVSFHCFPYCPWTTSLKLAQRLFYGDTFKLVFFPFIWLGFHGLLCLSTLLGEVQGETSTIFHPSSHCFYNGCNFFPLPPLTARILDFSTWSHCRVS